MNTKLADTLDIVISRASALRDAGVTSISVGSLRVVLTPLGGLPPYDPPAGDDGDLNDPLEDPITYGKARSPGFDPPTDDP